MPAKKLTLPPSANLDKFYIGGEWVQPASDRMFDVIMPSTEELYFRAAEAVEEDVNRAVAAARKAFDEGPWPRMSPAERAVYLRKLSDELIANAEILAELWAGQTGTIYSMAYAHYQSEHNAFTAHAAMADTFPFEERVTPEAGEVGLIVREPVGVVGAIVPWNGPFVAIANKVAPALLAGCTVVVKSSPEGPGCGYIFAEMCERVGIPAGVVNIIAADREVSEKLVRHPDVDKITFTGSTAAGEKIGAICGGRIARFTLELGGKSPAVVLDDYDVATAAQTIAAYAPMMSGQVCSSLTRLIVPRAKQSDFVDALAASFAAVNVGDPFDPETHMGPLAMKRQRDRVEGYIAKGKAEGARIAAGGGRPAHLNRGYYIEPTVFADVSNDMTIAREEIFGPVLSVIPADSEEQAIAIANDTPYGLNSSVFTNDPDRAYHVARQLQAGTVGHNVWRTDFSVAFGGFKKSGMGREGGHEGLHHFVEPKTVILDALPEHVEA